MNESIAVFIRDITAMAHGGLHPHKLEISMFELISPQEMVDPMRIREVSKVSEATEGR